MTQESPGASPEVARKINALLNNLHALKAGRENELTEAGGKPHAMPEPFDENDAQRKIADASINDAINGTSTEAEITATLTAQRTASQKALEAWNKQRTKENEAQARLAAELAAIDTRIHATEKAFRIELSGIATARAQAAKDAVLEAVDALFKAAAEYLHIEDLSGCDDGRSINYVSQYQLTTSVILPMYAGETRRVDQPHDGIHAARKAFLIEAGILEETTEGNDND